jgi:hypothetical protein
MHLHSNFLKNYQLNFRIADLWFRVAQSIFDRHRRVELMFGMIILSLIISSFAFKEKPPLPRAVHTVASAAIAQLFLSLIFNFAMTDLLISKGYTAEQTDFAEFFVRWMIGAPFFALIIGGFLFWRYKKAWIDDEADFE